MIYKQKKKKKIEEKRNVIFLNEMKGNMMVQR